MLLNLLLRNYLHFNLYELAEKLRSKTELPDSRSNQQYCRYLYYLGRIRAVQLDYSAAKDCLAQVRRLTPQQRWNSCEHKLVALFHSPMYRASSRLFTSPPHNACRAYSDETVRIVTLGSARQKMGLERWTNPKPQRRTCSPQYGVPSCRGKPAGVAKRPRERSPTRNP